MPSLILSFRSDTLVRDILPSSGKKKKRNLTPGNTDLPSGDRAEVSTSGSLVCYCSLGQSKQRLHPQIKNVHLTNTPCVSARPAGHMCKAAWGGTQRDVWHASTWEVDQLKAVSRIGGMAGMMTAGVSPAAHRDVECVCVVPVNAGQCRVILHLSWAWSNCCRWCVPWVNTCTHPLSGKGRSFHTGPPRAACNTEQKRQTNGKKSSGLLRTGEIAQLHTVHIWSVNAVLLYRQGYSAWCCYCRDIIQQHRRALLSNFNGRDDWRGRDHYCKWTQRHYFQFTKERNTEWNPAWAELHVGVAAGPHGDILFQWSNTF